MIQAIKDLANAFVPSGRLIELVDITLVSVISLSELCFPEQIMCFYCHERLYECSMFYNVLQPLMVDTLPHPFNEEIKGIASASGVPLGKKTQLFSFFKNVPSTFALFFLIFHFYNPGEVVLFNIFYEIFTVCTSVVAEDDKGGSSSRIRSTN